MALGQTPSQAVGPMYGFTLYQRGMERSIDGDGEPIAYPDAFVEIWQGEQFTRGRTDPFGEWQVWVSKPVDVPNLSIQALR